MSRPSSPPNPESPNLLSLVLHSKKALQHGEQLCIRARDIQRKTVDVSIDVLALDAKIKWVSDGIQEQLKLALDVAKCIETQRNRVEQEAKQWDKSRALHSGNLDNILDSLGNHLVPPDFYQTASSSSPSPFANPDSDKEDEPEAGPSKPSLLDRNKWKTLRDFIDERGVEDAVEQMENDRQAIDDALSLTEDHPHALRDHIELINGSMPEDIPIPSMRDIYADQESVSRKMAQHLESLASHYDQMAGALKDHEAGEEFAEEDLQDMNRDTDELPLIINEMEEQATLIEASYDELLAKKEVLELCITQERQVVEHLDELGDVMTEMLEHQQKVETDCESLFETLQSHLATLEDLHTTYSSYQISYNSLLLEMDRRKRYQEANDFIVRDMMARLEAMREEEIEARNTFYALHSPNLPDDLCFSITNLPTKWEVKPTSEESLEVLPKVETDLIEQARKRIDLAESISL